MEKSRQDKIPRALMFQIVIIGISAMGLAMFWFFEGGFFNTYLTHVLELKYIYVAIMVSLSAMMGLIFVFVFGILSDNTRTKIGRRRPYLLFGILAGISMILFAFSTNFFWCIVFDVIIIGVAANAYLAAHKSLIPDIVGIEHRGKANGIIGIFEAVSNAAPFALTLLVYENYTVKSKGERLLTQEGHFILLLFGGLVIIICAIIAFTFIKEPLSRSELPPKKTFGEEFRKTFQLSELRAHKELYKFIIASTIYNIGLKIITIYMFNYIFSLGLTTTGLVTGILIMGSIVMSATLLIGRLCDRYGRKPFVPLLLILSSIGCFILPFAGTAGKVNAFLLITGATLLMLGSTALLVPINTWQQDLLPEDKRGKFIGIQNITTTVNQIPAAFLAAIIADTYGINWIFIIIPIFFIGALPIFMMVRETLSDQASKGGE